MRVLHVGKYFPPFSGGIENFMVDLMAACSSKSLNVAAIVHDHTGSTLLDRELIRFDDKPPITLFRVKTYGQLLFAPISPGFLFALWRAIKEFNPDIIHIHMPNTSAFFLFCLPLAWRIPWIIHWHSDVIFPRKRLLLNMAYRLYKPLENCLLKCVKQIIVTSPNYMESSQILADYRNKCTVIPLAIDENRFRSPNQKMLKQADALWSKKTLNLKSHSSSESLKLLCIGRLTLYKGHDILIRAVASTPEIHSAIKVLIIGQGERQNELNQLLQTLDIGNSVELLGYQSDEIVTALLATCDLICLPSIDRSEAFGVVLLEAMYFGKPAIVSDIRGSGMTWVVKHGKSGWRFPVNDSGELVDLIMNIIQNPSQLERLGSFALNRYRQKFSLALCAQKTIALYQSILQN